MGRGGTRPYHPRRQGRGEGRKRDGSIQGQDRLPGVVASSPLPSPPEAERERPTLRGFWGAKRAQEPGDSLARDRAEGEGHFRLNSRGSAARRLQRLQE